MTGLVNDTNSPVSSNFICTVSVFIKNRVGLFVDLLVSKQLSQVSMTNRISSEVIKMKSQQIEHLNHILKSFAKHTAHTHFGKVCSKHHKDGKTIPQVLRKKQLRSEKNCRSRFIEPLSNPKCWINWGKWAGRDTSHSIWSEPRPRSCHPLQHRQLLSQTKPPGGDKSCVSDLVPTWSLPKRLWCQTQELPRANKAPDTKLPLLFAKPETEKS